jgi:hypothetical protein
MILLHTVVFILCLANILRIYIYCPVAGAWRFAGAAQHRSMNIMRKLAAGSEEGIHQPMFSASIPSQI